VGLAGIEPATSALSGRSAGSRSLPKCPAGSRFCWSSAARDSWGEMPGEGPNCWDESWEEKGVLVRRSIEIATSRHSRAEDLSPVSSPTVHQSTGLF
jgi:hypothetical protein